MWRKEEAKSMEAVKGGTRSSCLEAAEGQASKMRRADFDSERH